VLGECAKAALHFVAVLFLATPMQRAMFSECLILRMGMLTSTSIRPPFLER
jgi:hypothetical protein